MRLLYLTCSFDVMPVRQFRYFPYPLKVRGLSSSRYGGQRRIADSWAAMKDGRYPYDLIREAAGTQSSQCGRRLETFDRLSTAEGGAEAGASQILTGVLGR